MTEFLAPLARIAGADGLSRPGWLLLLFALVLLSAWRAWRRRPAALAWPALAEARRAAGSALGERVGTLMRTAALLALAVALAGPVVHRAGDSTQTLGLDLVLVLDTSSSMRALDAEVDGRWLTRLDLAREVVGRFARERVEEGDRAALVVFGESAFTQCPLTRDGRLLAAAVGRTRAGVAGRATALGDALALAVKRVAGAQAEAAAVAPTAGRVVVLLTDGRSNAGRVPVDTATALAASLGVRVHTVGIGSEGEVPMETEGGAAQGLRFERHDLDEETLLRIASATGGRYFHARASRDLEAVYADIDALERVPRRDPPREHSAPRPEPALTAALVLVVGELVWVRGLRRRLP